MFPKLWVVEDLQVCRESFQNAFLLLRIFRQNRENAAIAGHGERINNIFFFEISTTWAALRDFRRSCPEKC